MPDKKWLTTKEAAHYIGYSVAMLQRARSNDKEDTKLGGKDAPKHSGIGKGIRYDREELDKWVRSEPKD